MKTPYLIRLVFSFVRRKFLGKYGIFLWYSKKRENKFVDNYYLEDVLTSWENKPKINFNTTNYEDAVYCSDIDEIDTLSKGYFTNSLMYYQLLFHELGHSTMHITRMNRPIRQLHDASYLSVDEKEFLIAEEEILVSIFSIKLCASSNPPIKELNQIMWYNSNIFSKFAETICDFQPDYDFMNLEFQANKMLKYVLNK